MLLQHETHDAFADEPGQSLPAGSSNPDFVAPILARLERIETALETLIQLRTIKDFYSTAEIAETLGKAEFTVREWCRLGRIHAQKKQHGRGAHAEWVVPREELERFQREGLLPIR